MDFAVTPSMVDRKAVCTNCKRKFLTGDHFAERPLDLGGRIPVFEVICVPCAQVTRETVGG